MPQLDISPYIQIRVEPSEFKGQRGINIRKWFRKGDGPWQPTQKGIWLRQGYNNGKAFNEALFVAEALDAIFEGEAEEEAVK